MSLGITYTGVCPRCQRRVGTSIDGMLNTHMSPQYMDPRKRTCWGSGRQAEKDSVKRDEAVADYSFVWGR